MRCTKANAWNTSVGKTLAQNADPTTLRYDVPDTKKKHTHTHTHTNTIDLSEHAKKNTTRQTQPGFKEKQVTTSIHL